MTFPLFVVAEAGRGCGHARIAYSRAGMGAHPPVNVNMPVFDTVRAFYRLSMRLGCKWLDIRHLCAGSPFFALAKKGVRKGLV